MDMDSGSREAAKERKRLTIRGPLCYSLARFVKRRTFLPEKPVQLAHPGVGSQPKGFSSTAGFRAGVSAG